MEKAADVARLALSAGLCVGARVRLLKSIYDDGEDHHPPAMAEARGD